MAVDPLTLQDIPLLRTVALLTPPFASLTYAVPDWLAGFAWCPGLRVAVPLGRGMLRIGVVLGDGSPLPEGVTARPMLWPLEKEPLLPPGHMEMVRQLALRQAVTPGQILAMVLPAGLRVTQMRLRTMEGQGSGHGKTPPPASCACCAAIRRGR